MGGVALQLLELAQLATLAAVAGRAFSSVTVFLLTFVLLLVVVEARRHYRVNRHIRHPTTSFLELQKHPGIVAEAFAVRRPCAVLPASHAGPVARIACSPRFGVVATACANTALWLADA